MSKKFPLLFLITVIAISLALYLFFPFHKSLAETFSVSLTANPSVDGAPLKDVDLIASVSGTVTGPIDYKFDCTSDGTWELEVNNIDTEIYIATDLCDYDAWGDYTAKVSVQRGTSTYVDYYNITASPTAPPLCNDLLHIPLPPYKDGTLEGNAPLTVLFIGDAYEPGPGGAIAQYIFNFGDGSTKTAYAPRDSVVYTYNTPGTFSAVLTVMDDDGQRDPLPGWPPCTADIVVTAPPPDDAVPSRDLGLPSGTLPSGTTQATLSLTTDKPAVCRYDTNYGVSYASTSNAFSTTGGTSHSSLLTNLTDGSIYNYYIRCQDLVSPPSSNTTDYPIYFSVAPTPLPFTISDITPLYFFRDQLNTLSITGSDFDPPTNFYLRFVSGGALITSIATRPQSSSGFTVQITLSQVNSLPIGFYDLKLERSTDNQSQTYSQQALITALGDISSPAPGVRDGNVNIYDISRLLSGWGSTDPFDLAELDINPGPNNLSQGRIDLYDISLMMSNWLP